MIYNDESSVFNNEAGRGLYVRICEFIEKHAMRKRIEGGVLVGFSGGADSIFLLAFLNEYKKRCGLDFKILAVHVNHSIRGDEADFDEELSRRHAQSLGIDFISKKVDAKAYASENKLCLEEAARNLRYEIFADIIQSRSDISAIAIAHNANDNFETVLFNMMRGTGLRGISGISPIRDDIIRPILEITKDEITALLDAEGIKYACDSTNLSCDYSRNYIRHELIPKFKRLNENPENMISRLSESLREDNSFIESCAFEFCQENSVSGKIPLEKLLALHKSLLARVILNMAKNARVSLERVHISKIIELLPTKSFKVSLPKTYEFIAESGYAYISEREEDEDFSFKLTLGENRFPGFDDIIILSEEKYKETSPKVYKIAIQASFNFDIIQNELILRSKMEGDSYRAGGITRKLKKLFNDKNVPPTQRKRVPIICDGEGILYVAGYKVRDGASGNKLHLTILTPCDENSQNKRKFYII